MHAIIERLHTDHVRLARLVRLLNLYSCQRMDASAPNIALLVDALCYLTRFPDLVHHVIEDRMVDKLLARNAISTVLGQEIEAQHQILIRDGLDLLRDLESEVRGENMSQELVGQRVRIYAERLRHNMVIEELTLFPAAEKNLSSGEWHDIETLSHDDQDDPLFGGGVEERFAQLYRVINTEASAASVEEPFEQRA